MRISKEEKARRVIWFNNSVLYMLLKHGAEAITYDSVSKELGVAKSSVQKYYPQRNSFFEAIQADLSKILVDPIDTTTTESVMASWVNQHRNGYFCSVADLVVREAINKDGSSASTYCVRQLSDKLQRELPNEDTNSLIFKLFGFTSMRTKLDDISSIDIQDCAA